MKSLKTMLAINGVVFLVRAFTNFFRPASWYIDAGAPGMPWMPSTSLG